MNYLGFNTIIVASGIYSERNIIKTVKFLSSFGFKNIIYTLDHDVVQSTISEHLDKKKILMERLHSLKPYGIKLSVLSNVLMNERSVYEKQILRLSVKRTNFIAMDFPVFDQGDWIDASLNYTLYKNHQRPLFVSFQKNLITYDSDFAKHISNTRLAAYVINVNYFDDPLVIDYIKQMIDNGSIIIPSIASDISNYKNINVKINKLKRAIGQKKFTQLSLNSYKAPVSVLGLI